jgi:DNA-binding transcriptional regulator YhcF (GntR family)
MRIKIDRDLPVALTTQLQGQIEYGVSNGDFPPGSRLPSVRELAVETGVSPVTISQVYRSLQEKGLVESTPGRGTYVVQGTQPGTEADDWARIDGLIGQLLRVAERQGIARGVLLDRLQRAITHGRYEVPLHIVFVGVYEEVTRAYAADLRRHLRSDDELTTTTFDALERGEGHYRPFEGADVVLTFAHRRIDLTRLLPAGMELATVNLIPSERTRVALAEVDPLARVVLVSKLPEFLPTLRSSVERFAPHIESIVPLLWGTEEARVAANDADVVVYGTGSEAVLDGLSGRVRTLEFRHAPDPIHVERVLLPRISRLRTAVSQKNLSPEGTI